MQNVTAKSSRHFRRCAASMLRKRFANILRSEDGVVTAFATMMILMMLLVGGIGVDLMRNEMDRTRLQATLDRAVLAAADLDQELDPEEVVVDYFEKAGMSEFLASVAVQEGLNYRIVTATASSTTKTMFMERMGRPTLPLYGVATAEERVANVEISLVIDISGSMGWNNKMYNLQNAAKVFVDTVLAEGTEDLISISIVPYTAQVNAGPGIFNELTVDQRHDFSYCIDFDLEDFNTVPLNFAKNYTHMQHFEASSSGSNPIRNPGCPDESFEEILPFSQDKTVLKNRIDDFQARANTAIHFGVKWAAAMLDPSFRPITQALSLDMAVDPVFADRPKAHDDPETLKTIVLMTDGENVSTRRISEKRYLTPSHIVHWNRNSLYGFKNEMWSPMSGDLYYTKYTSAQADTMLDNICTAAKEQGIVIWSIGFETPDHGADVMESCASSSSHFFRVEGTEITDAFEAIARQINQLRLTQ